MRVQTMSATRDHREGWKFRVEGGCTDFETSPCPFSSATSLPREVGGQSRSGPLPGGCCGAKVDGRQPYPPKC